MAIVVFHSSSEYRVSACDTYDFTAMRTGLSCSLKQLLAAGSTKIIMQSAYLIAQSSNRY